MLTEILAPKNNNTKKLTLLNVSHDPKCVSHQFHDPEYVSHDFVLSN